jgi:hypothetical protein
MPGPGPAGEGPHSALPLLRDAERRPGVRVIISHHARAKSADRPAASASQGRSERGTGYGGARSGSPSRNPPRTQIASADHTRRGREAQPIAPRPAAGPQRSLAARGRRPQQPGSARTRRLPRSDHGDRSRAGLEASRSQCAAGHDSYAIAVALFAAFVVGGVLGKVVPLWVVVVAGLAVGAAVFVFVDRYPRLPGRGWTRRA